MARPIDRKARETGRVPRLAHQAPADSEGIHPGATRMYGSPSNESATLVRGTLSGL